VKLSRVNTLLLVGIISINGITIGMPFIPKLFFAVEKHNGKKQQQLERQITVSPLTNGPNRLIMPTALSDQQVYDGDVTALRNGVWHRPNSSSPDKGGNTVMAAHRFTYSNPRGAFYNLDKLRVGDDIGVVWDDQIYHYRVSETKVVGPNEVSIEAPTTEPQLTLYTCTPLTLPKDRLVVIAKPQGEQHE
jgi:LPXTG-site transpeptidase (sortase) family protein